MSFGEVLAATRGTGPTFLNPLCQLWPKYTAPGRETQRFHMHLLMCLLLQQFQHQNASTQRFGPGPNHRAPWALCVEAFCCWSGRSSWSSKNISKCIWNLWVSRPGAINLGHSWQRGFMKVGPVPLVGRTHFQTYELCFGESDEAKKCGTSVRVVSTKFCAEISATCQKTKDSVFTKYPRLGAKSAPALCWLLLAAREHGSAAAPAQLRRD